MLQGFELEADELLQVVPYSDGRSPLIVLAGHEQEADCNVLERINRVCDVFAP